MRSPKSSPVRARLLTAAMRRALQLLYNQFAWSYDTVSCTVSLGHWREWVRTALPYLEEPSREGRILEMGHGPGHLQQEILSRGWRAAGVDLSTAMGEITARRLRRAGLPFSLARGKAQQLPFRARSFRAVVATFPSEYIAETRAMEEISRVLQAGGSLVVVPYAWITGESWPERAFAWLFRFTGEAPDANDPAFSGWVNRFIQLMRNCGFQVSTQEVQLKSSRVMIIIGEKV